MAKSKVAKPVNKFFGSAQLIEAAKKRKLALEEATGGKVAKPPKK